MKLKNYREGAKLSSTYKVVIGDTFELISRKKYGTELEADRIAKANPGASEPLTPGITLIIPILPNAPQNIQQKAISDNLNEVAVLIDGKRFRFWDKIRLTQSMDGMDTIEFGAPFNADIPNFRKIFKPFTYKSNVVTVGGEPFFTGRIINQPPVIENNQIVISVSGYSLPGVFNDCTAPASAFPLEFNNQGLQEIATTLAAPFGIDVIFDADQGAIFERVALKPTTKILSFLIDLAKQRNLIISSTERGKLLFQQSISIGNPVARLQQGEPPLLSVTPRFSPQEYYSHLTGLESVEIGLSGSQYTVKNERLEGVIRPLIFTVPDAAKADVKAAVQAKMGRMFGNLAAYTIDVATWRDPNGNIWKPNTTIKLTAPDAMIYNEYEFIIRSVNFEKDDTTEIATLDLIIPGSFSGQLPEILPWDE